MTRIYDIAHRYVDDYAALDPIAATRLGIAGHDAEMSDLSPDGSARIAEYNRSVITELRASPVDGEADRLARDVMLERLGLSLAMHDAGETLLSLRTLGSPMASVRSVFDQMPRTDATGWANIAARLGKIPDALASYRRTLDEGIARGMTVARRQVHECARQAGVWSGGDGQPSFFSTIGDEFSRANIDSATLQADIERGVAAAEAAYSEFQRYLLDAYLSHAVDPDACGSERYALCAQLFNGAVLDLDETYAWAWDELNRIRDEMRTTAARIVPDGSVPTARQLLDTDPARAIEGTDAYRVWLQEVHDAALDKVAPHFDIDPRIRTIEVMLPPPGGPLAAYYTRPSEDFSRPGRTWFPTGTRTRFPKWTDVTTAYHEGVPGHHLQSGGSVCLDLSRYQRLMTFVSGHGEGWALYAERLMAELGYLENPDYYLGMLSMQALRAARVIVDIGMHLQRVIPRGEPFHPGETWTHDLAVEFIFAETGINEELVRSEVLRYLGWPAQAISYKVGERAWLAARDDAKRRDGTSFDLKRFHTDALNLGPMGLDQLRRELAAR